MNDVRCFGKPDQPAMSSNAGAKADGDERPVLGTLQVRSINTLDRPDAATGSYAGLGASKWYSPRSMRPVGRSPLPMLDQQQQHQHQRQWRRRQKTTMRRREDGSVQVFVNGLWMTWASKQVDRWQKEGLLVEDQAVLEPSVLEPPSVLARRAAKGVRLGPSYRG